MAKVPRTLKQKESVGSEICEPFGKYREKRVRNWDAHRLRQSFIQLRHFSPACRVDDEALVRRGNTGRRIGRRRCWRLLYGRCRACCRRFEEGLLVAPVQRQQVQAETGQEE
jgi:hypothetical protein